jgi:hypothetical protein
MTARHHHFLPQCYLRGFAHHRDKPRLFVVDGKDGRTFTTQPANIAQERDFHRIDVEGLAPDALETALAQVESDIAPALERIARTGSMSQGDDRVLVMNLAALIAVKNPRLRETTRSAMEQVAKRVMQMTLTSNGRYEAQVQEMKAAGVMPEDEDPDYKGMKEFFESGEYRIGMATGAHLAAELRSFEGVLQTFVNRRWALMRAPRGSSGFVTCDHPVGLKWSDPAMEGGFYGPGNGLTGTAVTFPVSKEVALIGTFEYSADSEMDLTSDQVAQFNTLIIAGADRRIFARDSSFGYVSGWSGKLRRGVDLPREIVARQQRSRGSK